MASSNTIDLSKSSTAVNVDLAASATVTKLVGSAYNDLLRGRSGGGESIDGGGGNDTIVSSGSGDSLTGGKGGDVFAFASATATGSLITDFQSTVDAIDLRPVLAAIGYRGQDPFGDGTLTLQGAAGGGVAIMLSADGSAAARHLLATVKGIAALHAWDFILPPPPPAPTVIDDSAAAAAVTVDLAAAPASVTQVLGSAYNDLLIGRAGGGAQLTGNAGNDTLVSQGAADSLTGGAGADVFRFASATATGSVIADFQSTVDGIDLRPVLAAIGYRGQDPFADGTLTLQSAAGGGVAVLLSADGSAAARHLLVTVKGVAQLHGWDFVLPTPPAPTVIDDSGASSAVTVDLAAAAPSVTRVLGSAYDDLLTGRATGGSVLVGNGGNDTLVSSGAGDSLTGGAGADVFRFAGATATGSVITDFQSGIDRIDLRGVLAAIGHGGTDPLADGTITLQPVAGGVAILLSADGSVAARQLLATVGGAGALQPSDFVLPPVTVIDDRAAPAGVSVDLATSPSISTVLGSAYGDVLTGDAAGGLTLVGNGGDDTLVSRGSADSLTGGTGGDVFAFADPAATGSLITDFQSAVDKVDLRPVLAAIGYRGSDPLADGTVTLQGVPGGTAILLSPDGSVAQRHLLATVQGATALQGADVLLPTPPAPPPAPAPTVIDDSAATGPVTIDLGAAGVTAKTALGSAYNDVLASNPLDGNTLIGNAGNDTLVSTGPADTLTGGAGGDVFMFTSPTAAGSVITDFQSTVDGIDLRPVLSAIGYHGSDPLSDGTITLQPVTGGTAILLSADGNPAHAHLLATVQGPATLHAWDFVLPAAGTVTPPVPPPAPSGGPQTLWVGANQAYHTIADAVAASHAGDTIKVEAGLYENQTAVIDHALTIEGVGGFAHFHWSAGLIPNGKAIFITQADVTFVNVELSGAAVDDMNGAGIRGEAGNLTVLNSYIHDNQDGILTGTIPGGAVVIDHSSFARNGIGDAQTHNVYIGHEGSLVATNNYFFDAQGGADLKSRALTNVIQNNSFVDVHEYSTTGYAIDLSDGNVAEVSGNFFHRDGRASNSNIIHFGGEVANPTGSLSVHDNFFESSRQATTAVFNQTSLTSVEIYNNRLDDVTQILNGPGTTHDNVSNGGVPVSATDAALAPPAGYGGLGYHLDGMAPDAVGVTLPPPPPAPPVDVNDSGAAGPVTVDLTATSQHSVLGSLYNDLLIGNQAGGSTLIGNDGNDTLVGQGSADTLTGGAGGDSFTFTNPAATGSVITDFGSSVDGIDLRPLLSAMHYTGADPFADGHVTTQAVTGGVAVMVSATGQAADAHAVVTVQGASTLHPWDFYH